MRVNDAPITSLPPLQPPPFQRMAFLAHALKCLQFLLLAACTNWSTLIANAQTTRVVVPAALFFGAGQHLNAMVYLRLKQVGVYYGARFGRHVPWVHGWPYSHIRDPQYVGALLSVVGAALLGGESTHVILCAWGLNYLYLIMLESQVPHSISDIPAIAPRKVGRPRAVSSAALNDASSPLPTPKSKRTPRTPALPVPGRVQRRKRGASTTRV